LNPKSQFVTLGGRLITYPFCVISDIHCHDWNQFSYINQDGINNRLIHILEAIQEAAKALLAAGGKDLVITGDLFHTRGSIKPSVFNPTYAVFEWISRQGITTHLIPGNHDLEGDNTTMIGNACQTLGALPNFHVYTEPTILESGHIFVPWVDKPVGIFELLSGTTFKDKTLFCHVGLSEVFNFNMGHTLDPKYLIEKGFKYVFAGHFHHHKSFTNGDATQWVFSVGALTHQTFGDIGTKAGYLIVYEDEVKQFETKAPKFVALEDDSHHGNYVRIKDVELSKEDAAALKTELLGVGALGVFDQSKRPRLTVEAAAPIVFDTGAKLEANIQTYIKSKYEGNLAVKLQKCAQVILDRVRAK